MTAFHSPAVSTQERGDAPFSPCYPFRIPTLGQAVHCASDSSIRIPTPTANRAIKLFLLVPTLLRGNATEPGPSRPLAPRSCVGTTWLLSTLLLFPRRSVEAHRLAPAALSAFPRWSVGTRGQAVHCESDFSIPIRPRPPTCLRIEVGSEIFLSESRSARTNRHKSIC